MKTYEESEISHELQAQEEDKESQFWHSLTPPPEPDKKGQTLHWIIALSMLLLSAYLIITGLEG